MGIGKFRDRITIQTINRATNQRTGEIETSWTDANEIWAKKESATGNEKDKDKIVTATDKTNFLIRYGHNIDSTLDFRIKYNNKYYDIESIEEVEFRTINRLRCVQRSNIQS